MRNLLMSLLVVGLLAAPSLGVINVSLVPDSTVLDPGQTTTVRIMAQGTAAGLQSLGGSVIAAGPAGTLTSNEPITINANFVPNFGLVPTLGTAGANGGWDGFGSTQTNLFPINTLYKAALGEFASYTVTAGTEGVVNLTFVGGSFGGYKPTETNKATVLGQVIGATITVTPEPITMALLAVGGLIVARRRR